MWRKSVIGHEAMKMTIGDNQREFDPGVVKLIIGALGIYPIGSLVQLSDGGIGRICGASENKSIRPRVPILIDNLATEFQKDTGLITDLNSDKGMFIAHAIDANGGEIDVRE